MSLPMIGMGVGLLGGALGAVGEMQTAAAQEQAYLYDADAAAANKVIANQERVNALGTAKAELADKRAENRRTLASMRAAYGMNGGDLLGSPIEVLEDSARELALDELRVQDEGRARNREGGIAMINADRSEKQARSGAAAARRAGPINAFSALLGGVGTGLSRMN